MQKLVKKTANITGSMVIGASLVTSDQSTGSSNFHTEIIEKQYVDSKRTETNHNSQSWPVFIYNMYEAGKKEEAMLKVYENISNTLDNQESIKRSIDTLPIELCSNELLVSFAMGLNVYLGKESKIRTQFCSRVKSFLKKESRMKKTLESIFA